MSNLEQEQEQEQDHEQEREQEKKQELEQTSPLNLGSKTTLGSASEESLLEYQGGRPPRGGRQGGGLSVKGVPMSWGCSNQIVYSHFQAFFSFGSSKRQKFIAKEDLNLNYKKKYKKISVYNYSSSSFPFKIFKKVAVPIFERIQCQVTGKRIFIYIHIYDLIFIYCLYLCYYLHTLRDSGKGP